jgi:hypothetical protein
MSKFNKILLILVIVLLIILVGILLWQKFGVNKSYYAVYLDTGDLYFGTLHRFPHLYLSDVFLLQRNMNDTNNPYILISFKQVFWGPEDNLRLSEKNIVWITKLSKDSQVVKYIENQGTLLSPSASPTNQPSSQSPTTMPPLPSIENSTSTENSSTSPTTENLPQ